MFERIKKYLMEMKEEYQRELEEMERYEEDQKKRDEEIKNRKRAVFKNLALNDDDAERLFEISFYCHHSLDKELIKQLDNEWKAYYEAGKESQEPILPYYRYVLERIEIKLKPNQL